MSVKNKSVNHSMQGVFVFVLLGLFALMSTLMVLLGAQMYRGTVDDAAVNNQQRVLSSYVRSMVRSQDASGSVRVEEYEGTPVIALYEDIGDEIYVTWIYQHDGYLWEQFTDAGYEFDPEDGTAICPANSFEPVLSDGLLTVNMTDDADADYVVRVALRCAQ